MEILYRKSHNVKGNYPYGYMNEFYTLGYFSRFFRKFRKEIPIFWVFFGVFFSIYVVFPLRSFFVFFALFGDFYGEYNHKKVIPKRVSLSRYLYHRDRIRFFPNLPNSLRSAKKRRSRRRRRKKN